jgi:hypothetical protein
VLKVSPYSEYLTPVDKLDSAQTTFTLREDAKMVCAEGITSAGDASDGELCFVFEKETRRLRGLKGLFWGK